MDWSNEIYVKVYVRETDDDLALSWEARALWDALMKKFDRSGVVTTKRGARGLAAIVRIPAEIVERVLPELLGDGRLVAVDGGYLAPNFLAAQDAKKSDKLRQKESREKRRSGVTPRDPSVTFRDETVTTGHTVSLSALLSSADPELSDPVTARDAALAIPAARSPDPLVTPALRASTQPAISPPPPQGARDRRTKLNHDAWQYAALEHARLRGEGISPDAVPWPVMPSGAPMGELVERVKELTSQTDPPDFESARAVMKRRVDVAAAEARRERHLRWFTPSQLWDAKKFYRAIELTPEEASEPRRPAQGASPAQQQLRVVRPDGDAPPPIPTWHTRGTP